MSCPQAHNTQHTTHSARYGVRIPVRTGHGQDMYRTCTGLRLHPHPPISMQLQAVTGVGRPSPLLPAFVLICALHRSRATLDIMAPFFVLGNAERIQFSSCQLVRPNATVDRGSPFKGGLQRMQRYLVSGAPSRQTVGEDGLTCRTERCDRVHEISL